MYCQICINVWRVLPSLDPSNASHIYSMLTVELARWRFECSCFIHLVKTLLYLVFRVLSLLKSGQCVLSFLMAQCQVLTVRVKAETGCLIAADGFSMWAVFGMMCPDGITDTHHNEPFTAQVQLFPEPEAICRVVLTALGRLHLAHTNGKVGAKS